MNTIKDYIFYKISDGNNTYVGSTCDFVRRKGEHKHFCNNEKSKEYNTRKYQIIRENGGWNCFEMKPIGQATCSKIEALIKEQEFINSYRCNMNSNSSYTGYNNQAEYDKVYRLENKEKLTLYIKEYQLANKQKITEYKKVNKLKISEYDRKRHLFNSEVKRLRNILI